MQNFVESLVPRILEIFFAKFRGDVKHNKNKNWHEFSREMVRYLLIMA